MDRRALLSCCGVALAGCSIPSLSGGDTPSTETQTPTATGPSGPAYASRNSVPRWLEAVSPTGWPMARGGPRRLGQAPNAGTFADASPTVRYETTLQTTTSLQLALSDYVVYAGPRFQVGQGGTVATFRRNPEKQATLVGGGERASGQVVHDGALYYGSGRGVYRVDATTGVQEWFAQTGGHPFESTVQPVPVAGTPAVADGRVYAVALVRDRGPLGLVAFDADSGDRDWELNLRLDGAPPLATPLVVDGTVVLAQQGDASLHVLAFDYRDGTRRWTVDPVANPPARNGTVTPASDGDLVFVPGRRHLYALSLADGSTVWTYDTGGDGAASPAVAGDAVYVVGGDGALHAVDRASGQRRWRRSLAGPVAAAPAVGDRSVVVSARRPDGQGAGTRTPSAVASLDRATGEVRWQYHHDGRAGAPAIGKKGVFVPFMMVRHGAFTTVASVA